MVDVEEKEEKKRRQKGSHVKGMIEKKEWIGMRRLVWCYCYWCERSGFDFLLLYIYLRNSVVSMIVWCG